MKAAVRTSYGPPDVVRVLAWIHRNVFVLRLPWQLGSPLAVAGRRIQKVHDLGSRKWPSYEGLRWSMRTLAPEARPATASWSAVAACASGRVAATWSESRPCASVSTSAASRAPSART
jgi:hypothetical protein